MRQELVTYFIERDMLLSPEVIELIENEEEFIKKFNEHLNHKEKLSVLNKELYESVLQTTYALDLNWKEFEKSRALHEKGNNERTYATFLDLLSYSINQKKTKELDHLLQEIKHEEQVIPEAQKLTSNVTVVSSWPITSEKRNVQDFVAHFRARYEQLKNILLHRPELQNSISIIRLQHKKDKEKIALVVMIREKTITKNGNIILTVEDTTGKINVLISKDNPLFTLGKDLTPDEVIGITGSLGTNIVFLSSIFLPDVPLNKELKKCPEEVYAAFISDIHFGSKYFLKNEFMQFIQWINGETGNHHQQHIAQKLKYLFIIGDVVDGVGIYPGQEHNLEYKDITEQYNLAAEYLGKIRKDVHLIMCPGQHDAVRISEPQPPLDNIYTQALKTIPNLILVTNPSLINIHASKDFPGFDVLLYHGASYHYFISNIDSLRQANSYDCPTNLQRYLLQKRHLAPSHGSSLYSPSKEKDPLVIDRVPDIFASGDLHRCDVSTYNNITLVTASCFQGLTDFMIKVGSNPNIARVPLINLKTREVKILNFSMEEE